MKRTLKIIPIFLMIMLLFSISTPCFATTAKTIIDGTNPKNDLTVEGASNIQDMAKKIIKVIRYLAIIVATVLIAVFGIKFMLGSAEEKAEYKKSFVPLIVGIVVVFGSTYIAQLIFNIAGAQ